METVEQFLQRADRIGFHPEATIRILQWKFNMSRNRAELKLEAYQPSGFAQRS
jgi:hypothetical protein